MSASSIRVKATWKEEDSCVFYLLLSPQHMIGVPSVLLGEWTFYLELEEWISSAQWPFLPGRLPGPTSLDLHPRSPPPGTWGCLLSPSPLNTFLVTWKQLVIDLHSWNSPQAVSYSYFWAPQTLGFSSTFSHLFLLLQKIWKCFEKTLSKPYRGVSIEKWNPPFPFSWF